jgi:hypothetical protein
MRLISWTLQSGSEQYISIVAACKLITIVIQQYTCLYNSPSTPVSLSDYLISTFYSNHPLIHFMFIRPGLRTLAVLHLITFKSQSTYLGHLFKQFLSLSLLYSPI